jgi:hypothetical protein
LLHIFADFACQSVETSERKKERGRIAWAIAGAIGHYAVDWTRKFGIQPIGLGAALDQLAHLAVILGLALFPW